MESQKSMNPKSRHFGECTNAQTEQHEVKNRRIQTTWKMRKPTKLNNTKPKVDKSWNNFLNPKS